MDNSLQQWTVSCRQLFDSGLPTGGYAHSQGLEGLVQMGEVTNVDSLLGFIRNEVRNMLVHSDIPVFTEAFRCVELKDFHKIEELDELATALRPTIEARRAGSQTGRQTWRLYEKLFSQGSPEYDLHASCSEFLPRYQLVVVSGLLASMLHIPLSAALAAYCHQLVGNLAQACIKLLGFGPSSVQQIIHDLGTEIYEWIQAGLAVPLTEVGSISPRWDIASARHAYSETRLYIS